VQHELLNINRKKIGGKWKPLILFILKTRPARFNKIKQLLSGISSNSLSRCLDEMERNGLIYRDTKMHASYQLTEDGNKICVMLIEIKIIVERLPDL
jgi:DNA-binding HxlR family transcriptional regulator